MTAIPQHADPNMKLYQNSYIHAINHTYSSHSKPTGDGYDYRIQDNVTQKSLKMQIPTRAIDTATTQH